MTIVKVQIAKGDRKVGAMVKALAVEVSGFESVKGTTKEFLEKNGYYEFSFSNGTRADQFREAVGHYLSESLAKAME